jgi:hypothetical protein
VIKSNSKGSHFSSTASGKERGVWCDSLATRTQLHGSRHENLHSLLTKIIRIKIKIKVAVTPIVQNSIDGGYFCRLSRSVLMTCFTSNPDAALRDAARSITASTNCRATGSLKLGCNNSFSKLLKMSWILGNTMWVLFKATSLFPNEWGSNLNISE